MKKQLHVLVVSGDKGSAGAIRRVVEELERREHFVTVVAEGPSIDVFKRYLDPDAISSWVKFMNGMRPDFVLCGLSYPVRAMEVYTSGTATQLHIPLGVIEDVPGAVTRTTEVKPNVVFTTDEIGMCTAGERHPLARIVVVGNHGVQTMILEESLAREIYEVTRTHGQPFVFTESARADGRGTAVEEQIRLLIECVNATRSKICIIPRLHPKWSKVGVNGEMLHAHWMRMLRKGLGDRLLERWGAPVSINTLATVLPVISVCSTVLTTSAANGQRAISLQTPDSALVTRELTGFTTPSVVQLGCATAVSEPCDLLAIPPLGDAVKIRQFDPTLVCNEIERFVR